VRLVVTLVLVVAVEQYLPEGHQLLAQHLKHLQAVNQKQVEQHLLQKQPQKQADLLYLHNK
jgi:hypothetical protein